MSANIGAVAAGTTLSPLAPASVMGGLPRYVGAGSTARVRPFPLYKVQLGDGLFSEKRARMLNFARLHDERRFLVLFNNVACRPNPGRTDADASGPSTIGGAALPAPVRGDDGAEVAVRGNASSASATAYVLPAGVARAAQVRTSGPASTFVTSTSIPTISAGFLGFSASSTWTRRPELVLVVVGVEGQVGDQCVESCGGCYAAWRPLRSGIRPRRRARS